MHICPQIQMYIREYISYAHTHRHSHRAGEAVQDVLKRTRGEQEGGVEIKTHKSIWINKAWWTLSLPQTSRANPAQCYSTHQEKYTWIYIIRTHTQAHLIPRGGIRTKPIWHFSPLLHDCLHCNSMYFWHVNSQISDSARTVDNWSCTRKELKFVCTLSRTISLTWITRGPLIYIWIYICF